ncbi:hypothetical protein [Pseudomonas sp.]|uniref:hypothetical protein n=1 Tax=Pseudomonas sp. TaxID=306 RepID=UPI003265DB52
MSDSPLNESMHEYYKAVDRLAENKPIRVPINTKITKKSVSLEAGKSAGSIKRNRDIYAKLIEYIDIRTQEQNAQLQPHNELKAQRNQANIDKQKWKQLYHDSLARELMLLHQLDQAELLLKKSDNIIAFPTQN